MVKRFSSVIKSDDEAAAEVRRQHGTETVDKIAAAVEQELRERRDLEQYQQNAYDGPGAQRFVRETKVDPDSGVSATFTKPVA